MSPHQCPHEPPWLDRDAPFTGHDRGLPVLSFVAHLLPSRAGKCPVSISQTSTRLRVYHVQLLLDLRCMGVSARLLLCASGEGVPSPELGIKLVLLLMAKVVVFG